MAKIIKYRPIIKNHLRPSFFYQFRIFAEKPVNKKNAGINNPQILLMIQSTLPLR